MKRPKVESLRQRATDWQRFAQEFHDESDRAAAILGAAWLDVRLHELIENFLVDDPKAIRPLFGPQAPLEPFGTRVRLAFGLGFISRESFADLLLIKDIRNLFAHDLHGMSFKDVEVDRACRTLKTPWKAVLPGTQLTARKLHEVAVGILANYISKAGADALRQRRTVKGTVAPGPAAGGPE